jgi:putative phosphoribosyl transferase
MAAADAKVPIGAVVSRGGRPDLAIPVLGKVNSPTLLLVGSLDGPVIGMNEDALAALVNCPQKQLHIVHGASHLFEEPGTMEEVVRLAKWANLIHSICTFLLFSQGLVP